MTTTASSPVLFGPAQPSAAKFDDAVVRLAVHAYVISIPLLFKENELVPLIAANNAYFVEGGPVIQYFQQAGTALFLGGAAYQGPPVWQNYLNMPPDVVRIAQQVDNTMRTNGIQVGQEFLWLAQVLPAAASGNWAPYQQEGTPARQQGIAQAQMIQQFNPFILQMMANSMQMAQPQIEQAIYALVCQLNL